MNSLPTYAISLAIALLLSGAGSHATGRLGKGQAPAKPHVYVAQTAAGSGDGSTCADAKSVSFFNTASNWGSGKPISPGAVVGLCGTITTSLIAQASGTSGAPITILFEPGAMLSQPVCPTSSGCLDISGLSYISVNGGANGIVENTDNGTNLGHQSRTTGILATPCNHCEIANLTIRNMYVRTGNADEIDNSGENCIQFNGSYWLIHDNTLHDASWCLYDHGVSSGTTDIRIYKNDIYNIDHGYILTGEDGGSIGNVWFYGNHVHDTALWDSVGNSYHHDGIHCYTGGTQGMHISNFYIYDNLFDGRIGIHMTSWVFLEGPAAGTACNDTTSHIWIFNNVATATDHSTNNSVLNAAAGGKIFFAHNTIAMPDPSDTGSTCVQVMTGSTYVNNAVGGCNKLVTGAEDPAELDHNAYAHCTDSYNCFSIGPRNVWTASFQRYRSQFPSLDVHSVFQPSAAAGSNAVGVGTNLNSMCTGNLKPLCQDIHGALRPLRMAPDAGAYQRETAVIATNGIGNVRIGASQKSVERYYGRRNVVSSKLRIFRVFPIVGARTATYHKHRGLLKVSYIGGRVVAVSTSSLYYVTPGGLGVGAAVYTKKLADSGWKACGLALVKHQQARSTAIRVTRGRIVALTVSRSRDLVCH